ncbi:MAG: hypothetical protein H6818_06780 [Phycisphaerales bacterium]|nr:hypothetical protein [Phycisphaerales bacterium]MCB9864861.1 hypothetical protein [Phycisphaerales bacterium]
MADATRGDTTNLSKACKDFVASVASVVAQVEDESDVYEHRDFTSAANRLRTAADAYLEQFVESASWGGDYQWFVIDIVQQLWKKSEDTQTLSRSLFNGLLLRLDGVADTTWITLIPIERRFDSVGEYFDLGKISIINHCANQPIRREDEIANLKRVLAEHLGVAFLDSPEVKNNFKSQLPQIASRGDVTVLGYPKLVVPLGHCGDGDSWLASSDASSKYMPLLATTVLFHDFVDKGEGIPDRPPDEESGVPQASSYFWHTARPVSVEALLVNTRTGGITTSPISHYDWEHVRLDITTGDWGHQDPIDPELLRQNWCIAGGLPLALLSDSLDKASQISPKFSHSINKAIRLVAKCKYSLHHQLNDVILFSVIATETILDPFDLSREGLSERFALFGSALAVRKTQGDRQAWYDKAKELYRYRSSGGHMAHLFEYGKDVNVSCRDSVLFFFLCLMGLYEWTKERFKAGDKIDKDSFTQLYRDCVL